MKTAYTIAEVLAAKTLTEVPGKLRHGSTCAVKYKEIAPADEHAAGYALAVQYGSDPIQVIVEQALIDQFIQRGC